MKKLILLDTHAIIHRAYHALPPLTSPSGEPVGAVYGFTSILLRILRELKPDYIAAAFDLAGPTFRHVVYERYKAQRPETPSDLAPQFSYVREVLDAFSIPIIQREGYEADDIIGTLAKKFESKKDIEVLIVTGDNDAFQLVRPRVKVYAMRKGITDTVIYDEAAVRERYGLTPRKLIDFKALKGDPSDNIRGVKGIGEKTATELIQEFGSIEQMYKALKKRTRPKSISESVVKKLLEGEKDAKISKELSTIHTEVPVEFSLDAAAVNAPEAHPNIPRVLERFGFSSLAKRMSSVKSAPEPKDAQASFFSSTNASTKKITAIQDFGGIAEGVRAGRAGFFLKGRELYAVIRGEEEVYWIDDAVLSGRAARSAFEGTIAAYDGKHVLKHLRSRGIGTAISFDILIAAYVASSGSRDFSPETLLMREFRISGGDDPALFGAHFFSLIDFCEKKLSEGRLRKVFDEIEVPLIPVLFRMEERGISLDSAFLRKLSGEISGKIKKLEKDIFSAAKEEFNINSTQQLSRILFEKLEIGTKGLKKTQKGGKISTRESELEKLKDTHPIIANILSYRELAKLESTYIDALPALVNPKTGRIHTTFNQTGTSTGRLSSQDPNLQNIPIMSEYGKEIRKAFVASSGFVLASFDYSQIELRVAAHMAGDKKMIEAFRAGRDIHAATASEVFNIPLGSVTAEQRRAAKTLNFGILYGMGASALSASAGMGRDEARAFIDEYFRDFSGIAHYIQETKEFAEANGYVETLFGRRRYIPEIYSSNWQVKREAERMAVNMPIQGTATGDIVKLAMIKIDEWVRRENLEEKIRMLLQVHDELVFEIQKDFADTAVEKIKALMESAASLKVPLVIDVHTGPNWGK
ncbi:MAG: DNA polymerase I [Candidatus Sungbacteria bacterium RIFCSPHIGHO2_01_FULL_50_25]|uniref:DNA polymerase I n=1 Tax=Candidatus Sungbacteria bacterium RIFCSPHIGHO2_01_FULL_50_25 TaxID=1802265 RepID=A0A1G2KBQ6_9BACT|nr:MAG: DNA polymerase I [Candidatus Sungbacteria bacterium RIFCSPHIGHO2_01_FULL_50_25]